jgi:hypothetical protein
MSGTFTIPEIRCNRHFYGATLCGYQAQAPINDGIVVIEPCAECLDNAVAALSADNAALREALTGLVNAYQDEITRANNDVPLDSARLRQARAALAKGRE